MKRRLGQEYTCDNMELPLDSKLSPRHELLRNISSKAHRLHIHTPFIDDHACTSSLADEDASSSPWASMLSDIMQLQNHLCDTNASLRQINHKLRSLSRTDKRVPPNSSQVKRSTDDARYLMSYLCMLSAKVKQHLSYSIEDLELELRHSLLWFPRSIECHLEYCVHIKQFATTLEQFSEQESHLMKAVSYGLTLVNEPEPESAQDKVIMKHELQLYNIAEEALILYLCQQGRYTDAVPHLSRRKYTWLLSPRLFCYDFSPTSAYQYDETSPDFLVAHDNFLPSSMIQHIAKVYRPESPYWSEHDYDSLENASKKVGYFSYLYPYKQRPAISSIEQIIDYIHSQVIAFFPNLSRCKYAEWWVHSRPHCSGHQLHFDSDETAIDQGEKPNHPIVTMIIYVTDSLGGPTLVTDQVLGSNLATNGWLCHPKANRALIFDAKYLHGVLPGRGVSPDIHARRLTFMVGFWEGIKASYRGVDHPGPGQPFPDSLSGEMKSSYTWHQEMLPMSFTHDQDHQTINATDTLARISPVWEPIHTNSSYVSNPRYEDCFQGF
jgi:hypothetical protein